MKWAPHRVPTGQRPIVGATIVEGLDTGFAENVPTWKGVLGVVVRCAKQTELVADKVGWALHPGRQGFGQLTAVDKRSGSSAGELLLSLCDDHHLPLRAD